MNALVSFLVTLFSVALVVGLAVYGINTILGQWSTLAWLAIGWCVFIGAMKAING